MLGNKPYCPTFFVKNWVTEMSRVDRKICQHTYFARKNIIFSLFTQFLVKKILNIWPFLKICGFSAQLCVYAVYIETLIFGTFLLAQPIYKHFCKILNFCFTFTTFFLHIFPFLTFCALWTCSQLSKKFNSKL
jgi:hypothetical protein